MKGVKRPAPGKAENNGKRAAGRGKSERSSPAEKEEESEVEQDGVQDNSKSRRGGEDDADDADLEAKSGSQDEEGKVGASAGGEKDGAADSSQSKRPKEVRKYENTSIHKYTSMSAFFFQKYPSFHLVAQTGRQDT